MDDPEAVASSGYVSSFCTDSSSSTRRTVEASAITHATGRSSPYTARCDGAAQTSARDPRAPTPRLGRAADQRATRARHLALVALPLLLAASTSSAAAASAGAATVVRPRDGGRARARTRRATIPTAPGSAGSLGAAARVEEQLALYGFQPQVDRFQARIPGLGDVELQNVVAVVRGVSARPIVVIAHRDNSGEGRGTNDNASGTAALIERERTP